jgi:TPR repeat protein
MFLRGEGVPQNDKEGVRWARLAAEQGDAESQSALGSAYALGEGVPQDYKEGVRWLTLAAQQGAPHAQVALAVLYEQGEGVPQDYAQAHMWYNLAGASGNPDGTKNRDRIARKMTPGQIAEAQRLAREWKPQASR